MASFCGKHDWGQAGCWVAWNGGLQLILSGSTLRSRMSRSCLSARPIWTHPKAVVRLSFRWKRGAASGLQHPRHATRGNRAVRHRQQPSAIPGAVFSGSLNAHVGAFSTASGEALWDYDAGSDFNTVNNVPAHGGSISVAGPVILGGTVYVLSGYDTFGEAPGNVLLAFSVDGQ